MASTILDEETSKKVIRQVEFYFSDSNLPRDNFLSKTIEENEDGLVSLALICSFTRMRGHLGLGDVKADGVPEDKLKAVADTLRTSDFLKISDDGKKVGRRTELSQPEEVIEQVDSRTVAASPLPFDSKLEDVETFFSEFGKVNSVRFPRLFSHKNLFCGTALIEFSSEEDAEKVLTQTLTFAGANLELKPKKDFDAERAEQEHAYEKSSRDRKGSEESKSSYPKGLIVAFTLKSKSDGDIAKQNDSSEHISEAEVSKTNGRESVINGTEEADMETEGDKNGAVESVEDTKEEATSEGTPDEEGKETEDNEKSSESADNKEGEKVAPEGRNAAESYKNNMDVVIREDLKALFEKFGTVKYIDFKMGESSGFIRFEEPEASQKARAAAVLTEDGGLVVKNFIAILEPVTGDQEKEYWTQIQGSQGRFRDNRGGHRGRGGKFNNRGGRHGRSRDRDSSAGRYNKAQKVTA